VSGGIEPGNWRTLQRPLPWVCRVWMRLRKLISHQIKMMRWAREQQAYESQLRQFKELETRRKLRAVRRNSDALWSK